MLLIGSKKLNKTTLLKIFEKIGFFFIFIFATGLSFLTSSFTFEYKLDRFSFELVDYRYINYSNNLHPIIMNISSDTQEGEADSYQNIFSYFYYNLLCNGSRIVADNVCSFGIGEEKYDVKLMTQRTFNITKELDGPNNYYLDYGVFSTYYKDEIFGGERGYLAIREPAYTDTFVFISDKMADILLLKYNINSYQELILNPDYCFLNIDIDNSIIKRVCINNIIRTDSRKAPRAVDAYGDFFALFYNNGKMRDIINLSFDLELKTNPFTNKKCFNIVDSFGYNSSNSRIVFNCYDKENNTYFKSDSSQSVALGKKYASLWQNNNFNWLFYVLFFLTCASTFVYYYFEKLLFGNSKMQVLLSFSLYVFTILLFSIFSAVFYSYILWGVSFIFSGIFLIFIYRKEVFSFYEQNKLFAIYEVKV